MKMTAHAGETRNGEPLAELRWGDKVLAKMYPNAAGDKIRIVFPELTSYGQTLISPDNHMIEFTRKP
jgi:hypothetical protein